MGWFQREAGGRASRGFSGFAVGDFHLLLWAGRRCCRKFGKCDGERLAIGAPARLRERLRGRVDPMLRRGRRRCVDGVRGCGDRLGFGFGFAGGPGVGGRLSFGS
ncbi:hypothetical protein GCM10009636_08750 [Arthrobacter koreensis]